jgi:hypothetical protein
MVGLHDEKEPRVTLKARLQAIEESFKQLHLRPNEIFISGGEAFCSHVWRLTKNNEASNKIAENVKDELWANL